jgi:hypothetical protein
MKRIVAITLFVAASFLGARTANADDHGIRVSVPFNFTVNNTSLPAGKYTIESDLSRPSMLIIRDESNSIKAIDYGMSDTSGMGKTGMLLFHHYGDQYFLSEIHFATRSKAIFLPASKPERRARKLSGREHDKSIGIS